MRNFYLQARFWTYSMMYGHSHLMPPFTLNHTNGSGSFVSFWTRLATWLRTRTLLLLPLLTQMTQSSSRHYEKVARRYRHIGRHRRPGSVRQTYAGIRRMREQRYESLENRRVFAELTTATEPIAHVPGSRAYRRLAWSRLQAEAIKLRKQHWPGDDYEQVP